MTLNRPDKMMLCIYSDGTKAGTTQKLEELIKGNDPQDALLRKRATRLLKKIAVLTEEEFAALEYFDALSYFIKFK